MRVRSEPINSPIEPTASNNGSTCNSTRIGQDHITAVVNRSQSPKRVSTRLDHMKKAVVAFEIVAPFRPPPRVVRRRAARVSRRAAPRLGLAVGLGAAVERDGTNDRGEDFRNPNMRRTDPSDPDDLDLRRTGADSNGLITIDLALHGPQQLDRPLPLYRTDEESFHHMVHAEQATRRARRHRIRGKVLGRPASRNDAVHTTIREPSSRAPYQRF